jgi:hypothetical protein
LKPISPKLHGLIDYLSVPLLLAAGPLFGFGGRAAQITSTVAGAILVVAAATQYPPSLVKLVPLKVHRMIDLVLGIMFVVYPHVFRFPEHSALFFFIAYGLLTLIVVFLTRWDAAPTS